MTYDGNIEAGIYIISQHLNKYGKPELALMAYNSGPTGAQKLWMPEHSKPTTPASDGSF